MQSHVRDLPPELRDLLEQYATSGPYIFDRLPLGLQARLIMFLPPEEILTLHKIAPEILRNQPEEFWIEKINADFRANVKYVIDGPSDYAVYMIGGPRMPKCIDSGCVTHMIILRSRRTGQYEDIDRLMRVAPGSTILVAPGFLYDYLFDNYPRYRVPLTIMDLAMGRSNRHVDITRDDQERWGDVLRNRKEFVRMVDNL